MFRMATEHRRPCALLPTDDEMRRPRSLAAAVVRALNAIAGRAEIEGDIESRQVFGIRLQMSTDAVWRVGVDTQPLGHVEVLVRGAVEILELGTLAIDSYIQHQQRIVQPAFHVADVAAQRD